MYFIYIFLHYVSKICYLKVSKLYSSVALLSRDLLPNKGGAYDMRFVYKAATLLALAEWCEVL